jgi:hypothetical protein
MNLATALYRKGDTDAAIAGFREGCGKRLD